MSTLFFFSCFLLAGAFADNNSTVQVTVYYESLCPDSIKFFLDKLIPTYTQGDYNKFLNISPKVEIVPYGKVNHTGETYVCQHGESECSGNKLHACAIKYLTDQRILLNYIGCLMKATLPINTTIPYPDPKTVCLNESGNFNVSITTCFTTEEGTSLFHSYENKTSTFFANKNLTVPFISFNDKYDEPKSSDAIADFRKTLCSQVGKNDNYCTDTPKSGASMLSASFALVPTLLLFFYATQ